MKKIKEESAIVQFAYIIFIFALMFLGAVAFGQNKSTYIKVGKEFRVKVEKVEPVKTGYTFRDKEGKIYDIYQNSKGNYFIVKKSKKTGKEYKASLPKEICAEIAKESN